MSLWPRYTEQDVLQCKEDMFGEKEGGGHNDDREKPASVQGSESGMPERRVLS